MQQAQRVPGLCWLVLLLTFCRCVFAAQPPAPDYFEPALLRGSIHDRQSSNLLFHTVRTATRSESLVRVLRDYTDPAGKPAARERVVYDRGRLISYELDEWQINARGRALIEDNARGEPRHIRFEYTTGQREKARTKTARERYRGEVLVNDMIPDFIQSNWQKLEAGDKLKVRYIVVPRRETVGFTFSKVEETTWRSHPVVRIRMSPSSFFIAALVDPIYFLVEKEGEHRVLAYLGRTVLKTKKGNKNLDALNVFELR